jgi:hypothetical protein
VLVYDRDLIYRVSDFEKRVETVSLRPWQWDLLFALDGRTPLSDVAQRVGVGIDVASETLHSLQEQGLVAVRSMRIDEYRQSVAPSAPSFARNASAPADDTSEAPRAQVLLPMPVRPRPESAPLPVSGEIAFSLKAPRPGSVPEEKSEPPHGSIGFKIK